MLTPRLRVAGIALLLSLAVPQCFGQDLGELARQERARRQSQPASAPQHVYTNEDMARPQILVKEDQTRLGASGTQPTAAPVATQVSATSSGKPDIPLGDVARYYRRAKQIRERQEQGTIPGPAVETHLAKSGMPSLAPKLAPAAVQTTVGSNAVRPRAPFPAPPGNDAPLGDIARYYRWLKEVRVAQRQTEVATADCIPIPGNDAPLGDVARYYRKLREFRESQRQTDGAAADHASLAISTLPGAGPAPLASLRERTPLPQERHSVQGPEAAPPRRVQVARGDSLWKLAQHYLGSGEQWRALAALNPQIGNYRRIQIGDWIRLPDHALPQDVAGTVQVRKGDTLWKIAATRLGNGLAWTCVAHANPDLADANFIFPQQILNLPLRCQEVSKARE
jgi:nucleoid-associated protein YgaU